MRPYFLFVIYFFICLPQAKADYGSCLKIDNEIAFESEYVHRGRKLGQKIFSTSTSVTRPLADGLVQAGLKSRIEPEGSQTSGYVLQRIMGEQFEASFNAIIPYVRYERQLSDTFTATIGYLHYYYPKMNGLNNAFLRASRGALRVGIKKHANEIMLGVWANIIFRPTFFMFYNFDFKEINTVGHLFAKLDLDKIGLHKAYILADTYLGFDHANQPYGIPFNSRFWYKNPAWGTINGHKSYIYCGAKLHIIYPLNERSQIKTGINLEANGNTGKSWTNFTGWASHDGVKRMLWYNLSAEYNF